ncbi:Protein MEI2-like 2 [Zancudomyces culisetae]|uniref:Protein MEI2-like 2 n=1 Tax=Zancudomyces culisetae TaxID=1213189 RepID=A0A1R1PWY1_ZANCU|nr:Protein MEI2-like 2 [Zancudomyces culisetae]|eukprot:OMH85495.1 Protein MEI2-like 2 [Zancudomyces culisetae]
MRKEGSMNNKNSRKGYSQHGYLDGEDENLSKRRLTDDRYEFKSNKRSKSSYEYKRHESSDGHEEGKGSSDTYKSGHRNRNRLPQRSYKHSESSQSDKNGFRNRYGSSSSVPTKIPSPILREKHIHTLKRGSEGDTLRTRRDMSMNLSERVSTGNGNGSERIGLEEGEISERVEAPNTDLGYGVMRFSPPPPPPFNDRRVTRSLIFTVTEKLVFNDLLSKVKKFGRLNKFMEGKTECKFGYFDLREAVQAYEALRKSLPTDQVTDIRYLQMNPKTLGKNKPSPSYFQASILVVLDSSTEVIDRKDEQVFEKYGEINRIHAYNGLLNTRVVEYYDTRSTKSAFEHLNNTNMNGKGQLRIVYIWDESVGREEISPAGSKKSGASLRAKSNANGYHCSAAAESTGEYCTRPSTDLETSHGKSLTHIPEVKTANLSSKSFGSFGEKLANLSGNTKSKGVGNSLVGIEASDASPSSVSSPDCIELVQREYERLVMNGGLYSYVKDLDADNFYSLLPTPAKLSISTAQPNTDLSSHIASVQSKLFNFQLAKTSFLMGEGQMLDVSDVIKCIHSQNSIISSPPSSLTTSLESYVLDCAPKSCSPASHPPEYLKMISHLVEIKKNKTSISASQDNLPLPSPPRSSSTILAEHVHTTKPHASTSTSSPITQNHGDINHGAFTVYSCASPTYSNIGTASPEQPTADTVGFHSVSPKNSLNTQHLNTISCVTPKLVSTISLDSSASADHHKPSEYSKIHTAGSQTIIHKRSLSASDSPITTVGFCTPPFNTGTQALLHTPSLKVKRIKLKFTDPENKKLSSTLPNLRSKNKTNPTPKNLATSTSPSTSCASQEAPGVPASKGATRSMRSRKRTTDSPQALTTSITTRSRSKKAS